MKNIHKLSEHPGVNLHTATGSSFVEDMTNLYRLNEVLHRLIKKSKKGNKNIQQIGRTFT